MLAESCCTHRSYALRFELRARNVCSNGDSWAAGRAWRCACSRMLDLLHSHVKL